MSLGVASGDTPLDQGHVVMEVILLLGDPFLILGFDVGLDLELILSFPVCIFHRDDSGLGDEDEVEQDVENDECNHSKSCLLPLVQISDEVCEAEQTVADDHDEEVVEHFNVVLSSCFKRPH